jgi:predicted HD superfamily hydrolase involved in NAD metabolism
MFDFNGNYFIDLLMSYRSADPVNLVRKVYRKLGNESLFVHIKKVAEIAVFIARDHAVEQNILIHSGYLHDIGRLLRPAESLALMKRNDIPIEPIEISYPDLLHQQFSGIITSEILGIKDKRVLDSIECHTTLKKNPSIYDMILFLADKLSWAENNHNTFHRQVYKIIRYDLITACHVFIDFMNSQGRYSNKHPKLIQAIKWLNSR